MVRWRVDGPRNPRDYEQDYERDYDQRQKGNQNEGAVADVRVRTRQSPGVGPDKTMMAGMAGSDANGPCLSLSQS